MKYFVQFSRYFVGILFIFSGLIKLNDPIGTAIKLEEYFTVFSEFSPVFESFTPFATILSVVFCVSEVVLGIAVLIFYKIKKTRWILLGLILFFTFLTFYSAYFNKVTDCGCFGDAIKLTPWTSFWKDILLLILSVVLFLKYNLVTALFDNKKGDYIIGISTCVSLVLAYWCIEHLSFIDFRAYKVGANISENMKMPPGGVPDVYETNFTFVHKTSKQTKTMTDKEYMATKFWEDTTWAIDNTKTQSKLIKAGDKPKITDYRIFNDEADFTQESLQGNKLLILMDFVNKSNLNGVKKANDLVKDLKDSGIAVWAVTSTDYQTADAFRHEMQLAIPFYNADPKVIKTIIRANPGLLLLKDGIVKGKWHHNDIPNAKQIIELLNN